MPEIIVTTRSSRGHDRTVLHQERVCARDLESEHFAAQLVERLGWALTDADDVQDHDASELDHPHELERPRRRAPERAEPKTTG